MTCSAKFLQIRPWGLYGKIGEIYAKNFIYTDMPFFFNSLTGQTPRWIFAHYGSIDVVSCKMCLLGVKRF